jgi:hypothetical protein
VCRRAPVRCTRYSILGVPNGKLAFLLPKQVDSIPSFASVDLNRVGAVASRCAARRVHLNPPPKGLDAVLGAGVSHSAPGSSSAWGCPSAVLLDEPTAHLDPGSSPQVLGELPGAAGLRSVLMVGHEPGVAEQVDAVVWLDAGQVVSRRLSPRAPARSARGDRTKGRACWPGRPGAGGPRSLGYHSRSPRPAEPRQVTRSLRPPVAVRREARGAAAALAGPSPMPIRQRQPRAACRGGTRSPASRALRPPNRDSRSA